ncbi:hypothetical protein E2C01_010029 [Portunus trituberculatus]|uniref:Uncharacterized protein n=1 Tax=Portunus trituberculatus TaxID=210409 RepID=A0A5B7D7A2_PORTR|nr:hypothetical protein [Portunus trituberculatus]
MECPHIAKFRPQCQHDLYSLIAHLLDSATLRDILREYPQFAPRLSHFTDYHITFDSLYMNQKEKRNGNLA